MIFKLARLLQILSPFQLLLRIASTIYISSVIISSANGQPQQNPSQSLKVNHVKVNPKDRQAADEYRQLGLTYRKQERFDEAIAALEKSVMLDPSNLDGRIILGWTQHLAKKDDAAALSLWGAIYLAPTALQAFNALGIVYLVRGDLPQAIVLHSWAALLKTDNEIAHYNLSLAYQRLQQYDLAIAYAQKAMELEPTNPHPFVALAITYWKSGDRTRAKQYFASAISVDGRYRSPEFLNFLNEAGFSTDQIEIAKQVLAS